MPTMFDDVEAKCPFFLSSGNKKISCEGIVNGCTLNLTFISQQKRNTYRNTFCNEEYKYCEIYRMLEERYEE